MNFHSLFLWIIFPQYRIDTYHINKMKLFYNQNMLYDHFDHFFLIFFVELFVKTFFLPFLFTITIFAESLENMTWLFKTLVSVVNTLMEESLMHVTNKEGLSFTRLLIYLPADS